MSEIALFIGFIAGILFSLGAAVVFDGGNNLNKPLLEDYYKANAERDYYKQQYEDLRFILEHLDDEDIELCSKEHFNCFVIKKDKKKLDFLKEWGFDE